MSLHVASIFPLHGGGGGNMRAAKNIEKQWFTMRTGLSKRAGSWKKSTPNLASYCTGLFLIYISY